MTMRQRVLLVCILSTISINAFTMCTSDSLYSAMYRFAVNMIGPEFVMNNPKDPKIPFENYLYVYDILDTLETGCSVDLKKPFAMYYFSYVGFNTSYILIKANDSFSILDGSNFNGILYTLNQINEKDPNLLPGDLMALYIKRLIKMDLIQSSLDFKIGPLKYSTFYTTNKNIWNLR